MPDPAIIHSGLSQRITVEGHEFKIEIYRLEGETTWSLEVVDQEDGASTVWDGTFDMPRAALDEVMKAIEEEGLSAFRSTNVIEFPRR